jgi:hypothetical protein
MPTFQTDLRCGACVEAIRPSLDQHPEVVSWSVDLAAKSKPITVVGSISKESLQKILQAEGYKLLEEVVSTVLPAQEWKVEPPAFRLARYWPLLLVLIYLLTTVFALEIAQSSLSLMRAMNHFMGGFFIVFSFFKLLNIKAFAQSYAMYDVIAMRLPMWGWLYPFVEFGLGIAYLAHFQPTLINIITFIVMAVSTIGVVKTVFARRTIQCACLGTVFNLPMSWITIVENSIMIVMSIMMLMM